MDYTYEEIEKGRYLFSGQCEFIAGSTTIHNLPYSDLPEVAFAGASNVGKSSLINALVGRKSLARTSSQPGRTKQLNFFRLRKKLLLVDLPGYGYAKASKREIAIWTEFSKDYLAGRVGLKRVCLLVDARRDLKENDIEVMKIMDDAAVVYQIVLTKADKVKKNDVEKIISGIKASARKHTAMHPDIIVTSSVKKQGLEELRAHVATFE